MFSLLDLCPEVLEEIVLKLEEVEDVISLGSSSSYLSKIVGQERIWRLLLSRTQLVDAGQGRVMEDRVRAISSFLSSLADSDAFFSLLHRNIYERFPAFVQGWSKGSITVSCPSSTQLHSVSVLGLELLALTEREGARHTVHKIKMVRISPSLLLSLASPWDQISELVIDGFINCSTEEEGSALVSVLERCTTWTCYHLDLRRGAGEMTWEGLGREVARGRVRAVMVDREVVGRREDLRAVWQNTEVGCVVHGKWIFRSDGEEGWRKIEEIRQ